MGAAAEGFGTALLCPLVEIRVCLLLATMTPFLERHQLLSTTKRPETARKKLLYADVTQAIIDAFLVVYNKLGFGFLENVYVGALVLELLRTIGGSFSTISERLLSR